MPSAFTKAMRPVARFFKNPKAIARGFRKGFNTIGAIADIAQPLAMAYDPSGLASAEISKFSGAIKDTAKAVDRTIKKPTIERPVPPPPAEEAPAVENGVSYQ